MEPFGPFEVIRELDSANGATVYQAKKEADQKGEYVIKVFSLERLASGEAVETKIELDPLFKDIGGSFSNRVNLQKKMAEGSPCFAPILSGGHDGRGAWYVTNFYARSVKGMLDRFIALESADLHHLVVSIVRAALHLKQAAGRSHGNLKPSNIFIDGTGKPRASNVVVSDPLPGGAKEAVAFELSDLRSIGELIYQLVMKRKVDFSSGWVILPVEATKEWTELFGKATSEWLKLCNKLLNPKLSLDQYDLSRLEADLLQIKPRRPLVLVAAPYAAAGMFLVCIASYFIWHARHYGKLVISTDPPGAKVTITPFADNEVNLETDLAQVKTTPDKPLPLPPPLQVSLKKGKYKLVAEYETINGTLKSLYVNLDIAGGQTTSTNLLLPHGSLVVLSQPLGAKITFGTNATSSYVTPYTNTLVKPGEVSVQLDLANYYQGRFSPNVTAGGVALFDKELEAIRAGNVTVNFVSDPPGASIQVSGGANGAAPWQTGLEDGKTYSVTAQLDGWQSQTTNLMFSLSKGTNQTSTFRFPYGNLKVGIVQPADSSTAEIQVDNQPSKSITELMKLPVGQHKLVLREVGYTLYPTNIVISLDQTYSLTNISLRPLSGFVRLLIDPPLPGIFITNAITGKLLVETRAEDLQPVLELPPTNCSLIVSCPGLGVLKWSDVLNAGKTNDAPFSFDYGVVIFTNILPQVARSQLRITGANPPAGKDEPVYQRPGTKAYHINAPGYSEFDVTNTSVVRQTNYPSVSLSRVLVPFRLKSDPPGASFYTLDGRLLQILSGDYSLPWGITSIVARLGGLDPVTNGSVDLKWEEPTNIVPTFTFPEYAVVVLTNLPDDITLREGSRELQIQPGPPRLAYEKPGTHIYDLYEGKSSLDTLTTNLPLRSFVALYSTKAGREYRNSIGMAFVKIPDLFGTGKDGWVGKTEVSQSVYDAVMGPASNASSFKGNDLPVENVSWTQAMDFCQKLTEMTQRDAKHPPGPPGRYTLPTLEEWKVFSQGASLTNAVYSSKKPARVGGKGPSNRFGVADVFGNVQEWLDSGDAMNAQYIGGSFRSTPGFRGMAGFSSPSELSSKNLTSEDLGFRVIWEPAQ